MITYFFLVDRAGDHERRFTAISHFKKHTICMLKKLGPFSILNHDLFKTLARSPVTVMVMPVSSEDDTL